MSRWRKVKRLEKGWWRPLLVLAVVAVLSFLALRFGMLKLVEQLFDIPKDSLAVNDSFLRGLGQFTFTLFIAPVMLLLWWYRDINQRQTIVNARKDTNLKEFQETQRHATGIDIDTKRPDAGRALQIAALHQMRAFLRGNYGEEFRRPAFELYKALLDNYAHSGDLERFSRVMQRLQTELSQFHDSFRTKKTIAARITWLNKTWLPRMKKNFQTPIDNVEKNLRTIIREEANAFFNDSFPLQRLNLAGLDLSDLSLQKLDLSRANLAFAKLDRTNMTNAQLALANLNDANLFDAHLNRANLNSADLSRANLNWAHLSSADLSSADLSRAKLNWAKLNKANLNKANLNGANLNSTDLSRANLNWAHLSSADLSSADLSRAKLNWANLNKANLNKANLHGAYLSSVRTDAETSFTNATYTTQTFFHHELLDYKGSNNALLHEKQLRALGLKMKDEEKEEQRAAFFEQWEPEKENPKKEDSEK